jgi:hypothetical protein
MTPTRTLPFPPMLPPGWIDSARYLHM